MFQTKERLNFYDCDPAGIIFYASLFKIAHTAYEKFLIKIFPQRNFFFDNEIVLPIVHCEANYFKPLKAFDEIDVNVIVNYVKESLFELDYKFMVDGELYAEAKTVHVCVDKALFKKTNLPGDLIERLTKHLDE